MENSGKIHKDFIYYVEPMVKFVAHLKNILCVNISEFALLYFRALFKYFLLLMHLNLVIIIFVVVGTSWTNMRTQIESLITIHSSPLVPPLLPLLLFHVRNFNE